MVVGVVMGGVMIDGVMSGGVVRSWWRACLVWWRWDFMVLSGVVVMWVILLSGKFLRMCSRRMECWGSGSVLMRVKRVVVFLWWRSCVSGLLEVGLVMLVRGLVDVEELEVFFEMEVSVDVLIKWVLVWWVWWRCWMYFWWVMLKS